MKNHKLKLTFNVILFFVFVFGCSQTKPTLSTETSNIINTFYGDALEYKESYGLLKDLTKNVGQRLSGSIGAKNAVLWSKAIMENYGFDNVYLQEVMVPHWERGDVEECFFYSNGNKVNLKILGAGGTISTAKEGITAEVIEVGSLEDVEKLGKETVSGKIVFYNKGFNPRYINQGASYGQTGFQRRLGAIKASEYGAVASIFRSLSSIEDDVPHTGGMSYSNKYDSIPHGALGVLSSIRLSKELKKNPKTKITVKLSGKWFPDALSHNVIGEIIGSVNPKNIITVGGHLDSWDVGEGAHDDGAGCVHAIGALRLFQQQKIKPKNTLRAVMFMNEENGLRGGVEYAAVAKNLKEIHIAAIESDASAYVPRGFGFSGNEKQLNKIQGWLGYFNKNTISYFSKGGGGADISKLKDQGVTLIGYKPDTQRYFDLHHTDEDTFDKINKRELELGAASMALLVYLLSEHGL